MNQLRVSILQMDIAWENKQDNLRRLREKLEALRGATEIIVLPETFSTGFSMNTDTLAEPVTGNTITTLRQWASEYQIAIAGSYIACEENFVSSESNPLSYKNSIKSVLIGLAGVVEREQVRHTRSRKRTFKLFQKDIPASRMHT